jgi:hypothetical protein
MPGANEIRSTGVSIRFLPGDSFGPRMGTQGEYPNCCGTAAESGVSIAASFKRTSTAEFIGIANAGGAD